MYSQIEKSNPLLKKISIYTDGACLGNPGPGGYGIIIQYGSLTKEISGGEPLTTNNRMELTAAIIGLEQLKTNCIIDLFSDSKYLVDSINKGWALKWQANNWKKSNNKPTLNVDLWERLLSIIQYHKIKFIWIKGHNGQIQNQRCDTLAVSKAKEYSYKPSKV